MNPRFSNGGRAEFKKPGDQLSKCCRCRENRLKLNADVISTNDVTDDRLDCGCLKEAALLEMALIAIGVVNNSDTAEMTGNKFMSDVERYRLATLLGMMFPGQDYMSKLLDLM
jgi:hypothetical protein